MLWPCLQSEWIWIELMIGTYLEQETSLKTILEEPGPSSVCIFLRLSRRTIRRRIYQLLKTLCLAHLKCSSFCYGEQIKSIWFDFLCDKNQNCYLDMVKSRLGSDVSVPQTLNIILQACPITCSDVNWGRAYYNRLLIPKSCAYAHFTCQFVAQGGATEISVCVYFWVRNIDLLS
jgi:hypothetical protein